MLMKTLIGMIRRRRRAQVATPAPILVPDNLTIRERRLLTFLRKSIYGRNRHVPTYREIGLALGIHGIDRVGALLNRLKKKGRIDVRRRARGIDVLG